MAEPKKYMVVQTTIIDSTNKQIRAGEIALLDTAMAKHYNALGFLAPFIEDEPGDDAITTATTETKDVAASAPLSRSRS
jgi:hypothetical protein